MPKAMKKIGGFDEDSNILGELTEW